MLIGAGSKLEKLWDIIQQGKNYWDWYQHRFQQQFVIWIGAIEISFSRYTDS